MSLSPDRNIDKASKKTCDFSPSQMVCANNTQLLLFEKKFQGMIYFLAFELQISDANLNLNSSTAMLLSDIFASVVRNYYR